MNNRTFTTRNQLAQVSYNTTMVADFTYDPGMRETRRDHGNALITRRVYGRSDNLPTAIINETVLNWNDRPDASFSYTYDANKNVVSETTGTTGTAMEDYSWTTVILPVLRALKSRGLTGHQGFLRLAERGGRGAAPTGRCAGHG